MGVLGFYANGEATGFPRGPSKPSSWRTLGLSFETNGTKGLAIRLQASFRVAQRTFLSRIAEVPMTSKKLRLWGVTGFPLQRLIDLPVLPLEVAKREVGEPCNWEVLRSATSLTLCGLNSETRPLKQQNNLTNQTTQGSLARRTWKQKVHLLRPLKWVPTWENPKNRFHFGKNRPPKWEDQKVEPNLVGPWKWENQRYPKWENQKIEANLLGPWKWENQRYPKMGNQQKGQIRSLRVGSSCQHAPSSRARAQRASARSSAGSRHSTASRLATATQSDKTSGERGVFFWGGVGTSCFSF